MSSGRVEQVWLALIELPDGSETLPGFVVNGTVVPLLALDATGLGQIRKRASSLGRLVRIAAFRFRVDVETIAP